MPKRPAELRVESPDVSPNHCCASISGSDLKVAKLRDSPWRFHVIKRNFLDRSWVRCRKVSGFVNLVNAHFVCWKPVSPDALARTFPVRSIVSLAAAISGRRSAKSLRRDLSTVSLALRRLEEDIATHSGRQMERLRQRCPHNYQISKA